MAVETSLRVGTGVGLSLTPAVRLGIDVIRMSPPELLETIEKEVADNPLLLAAEPERELGSATVFDGMRVAQVPAPQETLQEHLRHQIALMDLSDSVRMVALYLVDDLDERGYLIRSPAELAVVLDIQLPTIRAAISAIQSCDPAGVGARRLYDCLSIQLRRGGLDERRAEAVLRHIEPLMEGNWAAVGKALGSDRAELEELAAHVARLQPRPAALFDRTPETPLRPDLRVVRRPDGEISVELIDSWMPALTIDRNLVDYFRSDDQSRHFVEARLQSARALIEAVQFRNRTLLRVGAAIVTAQSAFFLALEPFPRPLTRKTIASELGLHPATVGRVVRGRSLDFDGQTVALETLFPSAPLKEGPSDEEIRQRIRAFIASERWPDILSDAAVARLLQTEGIDIARRTVAKYRECLSIPSSHIRRRAALRTRRPSTGTAMRMAGMPRNTD